MSDEIVIIKHYYPPGVKEIIGAGTFSFIGAVDESTVLKYPLVSGDDMGQLEIERKLLEHVCPHPRIIQIKGYSETGIYLERAVNGSLAEYILEPSLPPPLLSIQQQVSWCREAAEAVAHIHSRRVLHCNISPSNLLLDQDLHIKLADFQGALLSEDGEILLEGAAGESTRYCLPRDNTCIPELQADMFALGSTMYFIMMGHEVFPDLVSDREVEERFKKKMFPQDTRACSAVTLKCWMQQYNSADEAVVDLKAIETSLR
jgi:serine/threonine protein kinase